MSVNMTAQSIAVGDNWTKVGNDYVGDQPNGGISGGTSALAWSAPSGLADGNTLTITTDGTYDFGTKAQAAPVLYDLGDVVYENGVVNISMSSITEGATTGDSTSTPGDFTNTIYANIGGAVPITRLNKRHLGVGFHYVANSDSKWLGDAFAEGGVDRVPQTNEIYISLFYKAPYKVNSYTDIAITNRVGTFATAVDGSFAEDLILTGATDVAYMKLIDVFNDGVEKIAVEATRGSVSSDSGIGTPNVSGASITGAISGATADLDPATYILSYGGSSKFMRVWDTDDGVGGIRHSWTNGQYTTEGVDSGVDTKITPNEWCQLELHVDLTDNQVSRWLNGQLVETFAPSDTRTSGNSPTLKLIGVDGKQTYNLPEFGEIYVDSTPQRAVIGDASTWAACTRRELQRATAWGVSEVTSIVNTGDISGSKYLYIVDATGAPVSTNGVEL